MANGDSRTTDTMSLRGARLVLPDGVAVGKAIRVERGRVARILDDGGAGKDDAARELNLEGLTLFPGFVDVQSTARSVWTLWRPGLKTCTASRIFLAQSGVTSWRRTLVPASKKTTGARSMAVGELMRAEDERFPRASAARRTLRRPFRQFSAGAARSPQFFRTFTGPPDVESLPTLDAPGAAHLMTLAPEIEGGIELVRELRGRGWVVSIGHTRAGVEVLEQAREAGARHMTHFLNAMSPLHQRTPGPIGWGLLADDVSVDLIADGIHSDPLMLRLVLRCKTPERVSLISDAVAPAGLGDGEYRVWGETIRVRGGRTSNERGSIAGSVITMLDAVRTVSGLGLSETEIARVASLNPARLLGMDADCGSIEEGKRADLTALDAEGRVRLTLVGGRIAFDAL